MDLTKEEVGLLRTFYGKDEVEATFESVQCLTRHGLLDLVREDGGTWYWRCSRSAVILLEKIDDAINEKNEEKAEHCADQRYSRRTAVYAGIVGAIIGALCGAGTTFVLTERALVLSFFSSLFH